MTIVSDSRTLTVYTIATKLDFLMCVNCMYVHVRVSYVHVCTCMYVPDGSLNRANLQTARSEDFYTLRGGGEVEVYEPRFTYHGFRYAEVCNWPGVPTLDSVRGQVLRAGEAVGNMIFPPTKAGALLNKISHAVTWTEVR